MVPFSHAVRLQEGLPGSYQAMLQGRWRGKHKRQSALQCAPRQHGFGGTHVRSDAFPYTRFNGRCPAFQHSSGCIGTLDFEVWTWIHPRRGVYPLGGRPRPHCAVGWMKRRVHCGNDCTLDCRVACTAPAHAPALTFSVPPTPSHPPSLPSVSAPKCVIWMCHVDCLLL